MTKKLVILLDKSGSMFTRMGDTIEGFTKFIRDQQKLGIEISTDFVQFNDLVDPIFRDKPISEFPKLTPGNYSPEGGTSLFDAIGSTIDKTGRTLASLEESKRPEKVTFVIITDGQERDSTDYTLEDVKAKIEHQTNIYSWDFIFLGANLEGMEDAKKVGISKDNSILYDNTSAKGISDGFNDTSRSVTMSLTS